MFDSFGKILITGTTDDESLYELAIENGADDLNEIDSGKVEIVCPPKDLSNLKEKVIESGYKVEISEVVMEAENNIPLDIEQSEKNIKLTDTLEDLDDVQEVYTNADLDESVFRE